MFRPLAIVALLIALATVAACGEDEGESTPATTTVPAGATGPSGADDEAEDALAQKDVRAAQRALDSYAAGNDGSYEGADPNSIGQISPVTSDVGVKAEGQTYSVTATSGSGNTFSADRDANGSIERTCTQAGVGGCDENGEW